MFISLELQAMNPPDQSKWIKALMLRIHVITGWTLPANELLQLFIDQFQLKVEESWGILNPDEIEYAFRANGPKVKNWGSNMSINLLDEVLSPYIQLKEMAARIAKCDYLYQIKIKEIRAHRLQSDIDLLPINQEKWWSTSIVLNKLAKLKNPHKMHYLENFPATQKKKEPTGKWDYLEALEELKHKMDYNYL